ADDAGGGGQDVPGRDSQGLAGQAAAFLSQVHPVGGAGVGVAAVDQDGLGIAVGQVGPVHLDGCAADLVGGVDPRRRAADVGLDESQVILGVVAANAAV